MTAHDHTTFVPGCYRCELGRDEVYDAVASERDELDAHLGRLLDAVADFRLWAPNSTGFAQAHRTLFDVANEIAEEIGHAA